MPQDSSGQTYHEVNTIRVTAIEKTWDNERPGLRIQSYKGNGKALNPGAEIAIADKETAYRLIDAITKCLGELGI